MVACSCTGSRSADSRRSSTSAWRPRTCSGTRFRSIALPTQGSVVDKVCTFRHIHTTARSRLTAFPRFTTTPPDITALTLLRLCFSAVSATSARYISHTLHLRLAFLAASPMLHSTPLPSTSPRPLCHRTSQMGHASRLRHAEPSPALTAAFARIRLMHTLVRAKPTISEATARKVSHMY